MDNKKLFMLVFCIVLALAILAIPTNAFAATELYQADFDEAIEAEEYPTSKGIYYDSYYGDFEFDPGEYTIMENIDLGENSFYVGEGEFVFDLNGKTITSAEYEATFGFYNGQLTITGNGTIENTAGDSTFEAYIPYEDNTVEITIESGEFIGGIEFYGTTDAVIVDATVEGPVVINSGSNVTIQDGTYTAENSDAIYVWDGSSVTINGGTFTSPYNALTAENGENYDYETGEWVVGKNPAKVVICGGTFTGGESGIVLFNVDQIVLKGGTFEMTGEGDYPKGAISATAEGEDVFLSFLGDGFVYSEGLQLTPFDEEEYQGALYTQSLLSVVYFEENSEDDTVPEITNGADQTFEGEDLTITCSGEFAEFVGLEMDGVEVDTENYDAESGSTIVTLKAAYLASLDAGVHTLGFVYSNGEKAETTITIPEPEAEVEPEATSITPKTGDNIVVYVTLFVIATIGTVVLVRRKK